MSDFSLYKDFAFTYFGAIYDTYEAYCANYKTSLCNLKRCEKLDCYFAHSERDLERAVCLRNHHNSCIHRDCKYAHCKLPVLPIALDKKVNKMLRIQEQVRQKDISYNSKKRKLNDAKDQIEDLETRLDRVQQQNAMLREQVQQLELEKANMKAEFDFKLNQLSYGVNSVMGNLYNNYMQQYAQPAQPAQPKTVVTDPKAVPTIPTQQTQPLIDPRIIEMYKQMLATSSNRANVQK